MEEKFKTKSEYLDFVEQKFEDCFSSKGYIEEQPVNITSQVDKTVDFIGSKISPLKKYILTEDFGENGRFLIQNSMKLKSLRYLKETTPQKFGSYYKCMGTLSKPDLEKVVFDMFEYLTYDKYLGIDLDDICIKICSKDDDLMGAIRNVDSKINREIDKTSIEHYRHKYGMSEENITGRDFNIGIRKKGTSDYFSCGTFVLMESPSKKIAIDMGIGNCSLSMCKFGVDSTVQSSRMADLVSIDSIEKEKFADSLIAVSTLLKEDIINHPSKHFRKKFRQYFNALSYWSEKLNISKEEILVYALDYLNLEYKENFSYTDERFAKILTLHK